MLCWKGSSVRRKEKTGLLPVYLNVYDLTPMNAYGYWLGLGVFHSGVEVHGVEYAFGAHEAPSTGIFEVEPKKCPGFTFRKSILVGKTDMAAKEVRVFMEKLAEEYRGNKYNLISRNCNHFCNEVCVKLTQKPIPRWVNRLARLGVLCNCVLPPRFNETKVRRVVKGELSEEERKKRRNRSRSGPLLSTSSSSSTPDSHGSHIRAKSTGNPSSSSSTSGSNFYSEEEVNDALGILSFSFDLQKRNTQGTYNIITLSGFFVSHPTLKNASLYNFANNYRSSLVYGL